MKALMKYLFPLIFLFLILSCNNSEYNKETAFFKDYREKSIPASKVPDEVVEPLVKKVMSAPEEMLINVSDIFDYKLEPKKDSFAGFVCEECGEMTVESYGRLKNNEHVCIDCATK